MIPVTRKEHYLNRIVGNMDYPIPEKPITTEEFFFAAILGEAVQAPEPLTRYQIYLAKIAGREIEIPYPEVRLEYFLARAAGMDVEAPTPITREEIFWSNYSAIVDFEVEGVPPLTYKAIEGTLENYRIYGNTVGGESVGDLVESGEHAGEYKVPVVMTAGGSDVTENIYLTGKLRILGGEAEYIDYAEQKQHRVRKNLFDKNDPDVAVGYGIIRRGERTGEPLLNSNLTATGYIPVEPGQAYTNNASFRSSGDHGIAFYDENKNPISGIQAGTTTSATTPYTYTAPDNAAFMRIPIITSGSSSISIDEFQVEKGTAATAYEPYIHDIEPSVILPGLQVLPGTNVLTVGTAVQPSKVYVKYKGERQ